MNKISKKTRSYVFDIIKIENVHWAGRLDDLDFLNRIFNLEKLPSDDHRYENMSGDVWQHRVNNPDDWPDDWIFYDTRLDLLNCDDTIFLEFLCEMLSPVVRPDSSIAYKLQQNFNSCLNKDGYEIVEKTKLADRPVFSARSALTKSFVNNKEEITNYLSEEYVSQQISLMESSIDSAPHISIGTSKELIEMICKTILSERNITVDKNWDVPKLLKETSKILKLTPEDIPNEARAASTIKSILGSLSNVVQGIAELRNSYGSGHGKDAKFKGLNSRHAKLAVGASSTLAIFLLETHKIR